ncbi:carboxypeptidase-like regulatory domain-containing protein [Shewanella marina]|uniref:carboxypeptidase-like regulatory domain-containing protein n=1 Tax=Shewanella marina TaxID=487319 RepID=UPI00046F453E|nr:carboxypeptidase-like regulatory domain-containing protein [Shewanella marina]
MEPTENSAAPVRPLQKLRPKYITLILFILSAVYLIPEAVFNAKLVSVAGGGGSSHEELHLVELFGRTISGIGVSLLVLDMLLKGALVRTKLRTFMCSLLIVALVWPTVFFGQKLLVDKLLVDPSTPTQRQEAFFASMLRSGLAINAVKISGLPYNSAHAALPAEMTFLALMGGLVYANSEFIDHVEKQQQAIVGNYITNRAGLEFPKHYAQYQQLRDQVNEAWTQYQGGVKKYNAAIASSPSRADKAWQQVENEIASGWKKYQQAEKSYLARAESRAQKIAPQIYDAFEDKNRCIDRYQKTSKQRGNPERLRSCIRNVEEDYARILKRYDLPFKPMDFWLIREEGRIRGETSIKESILTLGLSALLAGIEIAAGDAGEQVVKMVFTNKVSHYTPKILALYQAQFKRETGYPMGINSMLAFRHHEVTSAKVRKSLAQKDIILGKSWHITDYNQFEKAVATKVRKEANRQWQQQTAAQGLVAKPNLNFNQFQRLDSIQNRIKAKMGERYYVNPVLATWNNKQFYQHVIVPNINKERDYWLAYLDASLAQFADGGPLAEDGKSALRSVLVPPISMSISLLLVILTALKLPIKFWQVVKPSESHSHKWLNGAVSFGLIIAVLLVPVTVLNSKFTEETSTTGYFFDKVSENSSPVVSYALTWVIHTQPLVQPIGYAIDNQLGITQLFKQVLEAPINEFDKVVMAELNPPISHEALKIAKSDILNEQGTIKLLPFTVDTNVANAKVRIMNIKPSYKAGMMLPPSNYDVEISAPGYQTQRLWLKHNSQGSHKISLTRQ